jgi:hypothetical protein
MRKFLLDPGLSAVSRCSHARSLRTVQGGENRAFPNRAVTARR